MATNVGVEDVVLFSSFNYSLWRDGSFHRNTSENLGFLPASPSGKPVSTRDIPLNPIHGTFARIYLPHQCHESDTDPKGAQSVPSPDTGTTTKVDGAGARKLPILLYFHGGAFIGGSTKLPSDHGFYCKLSLRAEVIIVSVEYRHAPEHPLPAAYHDCFEALLWLDKQAKLASSVSSCSSSTAALDPWLAEHADFSRCFLGGDSAGANIVHHVALRAVLGVEFKDKEEEGEDGGKIGLGLGLKGLIYIHPYFTWGSEEEDNPWWVIEGKLWELSGTREGGRFRNPHAGRGAGILERAKLPPSLVAIAERDYLKGRGERYHGALRGAGKESKLFLSPNEEHVFHLKHPDSENVGPFLDELSAFLAN